MEAYTENENEGYNEYMDKAFKTIYTILNRLEKSLDVDNFDVIHEIGHKTLGISERRWQHYIKMLSQEGYVEGVVEIDYIDGSTGLDLSEICITLKGLQYLAENALMVRAFKAFKEVKGFIS